MIALGLYTPHIGLGVRDGAQTVGHSERDASEDPGKGALRCPIHRDTIRKEKTERKFERNLGDGFGQG